MLIVFNNDRFLGAFKTDIPGNAFGQNLVSNLGYTNVKVYSIDDEEYNLLGANSTSFSFNHNQGSITLTELDGTVVMERATRLVFETLGPSDPDTAV